MRILRSPSELKAGGRKVCLAIGFFDGVHLGHQQVIRQTITDAASHEAVALVITFDRHPNSVVAPARVPPLIYSLEKKLRSISELGAETLLLLHFDKALSEKSGEAFIRDLIGQLGSLQCVCVGANFVFGHKRGGNVELLKTLGRQLHFSVHGMAAVALDGEPVSSTRIRAAIATGNLDDASQMLGRAYGLTGKVVRGDGVGRQIGFPTANLDITGLAVPPGGVYAVQAHVEQQVFRAVLNIGYRPTRNDPNPQLHAEAHLLDFSGELYDREVEITFVDKLREEKRFPTLEELRRQIARDIEEAQARF